MFYGNNIDFSEVGDMISSVKDKCPSTSCLRELVDYLQEQIEFLEDECSEREENLDLYDSYDD
tara:strand:+ start:2947 stop:3135 length:189 start_codon:yes stop_codon:yes gene_type:complete